MELKIFSTIRCYKITNKYANQQANLTINNLHLKSDEIRTI